MHITVKPVHKYSHQLLLVGMVLFLGVLFSSPSTMAQGWKSKGKKKSGTNQSLNNLNIEGDEPILNLSSSPMSMVPTGEHEKEADPPLSYTASPEFFNLEGTWESQSSDSRFAKIDIFATIMGNYRARPYFDIGGLEVAFPKIVPLQASELDLAYTTKITGSKSWIMPRVVNGEEIIKVYTFMTDVSGQTTGMVTDLLTRVGASVLVGVGMGEKTNGEDLVDYWVNEWKMGQQVPRFQILKGNLANQLNVRPYFLDEDGKVLIKEDRPLRYDQTKGHYKATFEEGGVTTHLLFRPLTYSAKAGAKGMELIVENIYGDGTPVGVYRQFFIRDPNAEVIVETEKLGKSLEGTWANYDEHGRLVEVVIKEGEAEVRVRCEGKGNKKCSLGSQALEKVSENVVGIKIDGVFYIRTIEIDIDLASNYVNGQLSDHPKNVVISATLKHKGGMESDKKYSEVFKLKPKASIFPEKAKQKVKVEAGNTSNKRTLPWLSGSNQTKTTKSSGKWRKN